MGSNPTPSVLTACPVGVSAWRGFSSQQVGSVGVCIHRLDCSDSAPSSAPATRFSGQLATRFHLTDWEHSIQRKLEVIEGIYEVLSDQASTYRAEVLEIVVVALIVIEVVLALFHR